MVIVTAVPSTKRSPGRTSGKSAARAEENGAPTSVTANSRTTSRPTGTPRIAMTRTRTQRMRSQAIMTWRRGSRSARPLSITPPRKVGTMLAAKVTAASRADPVRSYTRTVSATRASWSPPTERIWPSHSARNSGTPKTSRKAAFGSGLSPAGPVFACAEMESSVSTECDFGALSHHDGQLPHSATKRTWDVPPNGSSSGATVLPRHTQLYALPWRPHGLRHRTVCL